jgi:hypothetical protein
MGGKRQPPGLRLWRCRHALSRLQQAAAARPSIRLLTRSLPASGRCPWHGVRAPRHQTLSVPTLRDRSGSSGCVRYPRHRATPWRQTHTGRTATTSTISIGQQPMDKWGVTSVGSKNQRRGNFGAHVRRHDLGALVTLLAWGPLAPLAPACWHEFRVSIEAERRARLSKGPHRMSASQATGPGYCCRGWFDAGGVHNCTAPE